MTDPSSPTSAPTPGPASGPDALETFEERLAELLAEGTEEALDAFLASLPAELHAEPPEAEPAAARRSSAELRALAGAGRGAPWPPREGVLRAGYLIEGASGAGTARVLPAFALALAAPSGADALRARFEDLWAVDLAVWSALDQPARTVARLWLESPGRRLLQDLRALQKMVAAGPPAVTLARIHRAAGVDDAPPPREEAAFERWKATRPPAWNELHLTAPGRAMLSWAPRDEETQGALAALDLADEGSPASLRGAALAWLLQRMIREPRFKVDGISRDLRDDLPARLAGALSAQGHMSAARAPLALEEVALAHAARLNAADTAPGAVFRTWGVARWLAGCLWRSPFFGGDEPALAERLRALLPANAPPVRSDPLDAGRFDRARGLDAAEVALVGGALAQPLRADNALALPSAPLVRSMRRIAARAGLRSGEEDAEASLCLGENELSWPAPHVAPPLVARWWLTERQIHWLAEIPEAAQLHTIELLAREPRRLGWSCFAVMEEGASLAQAAKRAALAIWRTWRAGGAAPLAHEQCALGIGVLDGLDDEDASRVISVASSADGTWPPFLLDAIAKAAERTGRAVLFHAALEELLSLASSAEADLEVRLNAALFVAWRTSSRKLPADDIAARLSRLAQEAPFNRHAGLVRELRRRGAAAGGGR